MIRHLFKLVWNRKRTNLFIVLEIFCSFLVVFGLCAAGLYMFDRYRQTLGFDHEDLWYVNVSRNSASSWDQWKPDEAETFKRLLDEVTRMDPVVAATGSNTAPYKGSTHITGWEFRGQSVDPELSFVTPSFAEVLGLELVAGRWIQPEDGALDYTPIVIDEDLAHRLVGDEDPIGQRVTETEDDEDLRVVGVVRDYRRSGELDENVPYVFYSSQIEDPEEARTMTTMIVRLQPGTSAAFEEDLLKKLQSVAHGWTFRVTNIAQAREEYLKRRLIPLAFIGLIAAFLLLMVVLGLTGVMWQNVTRRTREIGLRRATGAHRGRIQRQIVGEVGVTAALGLVAGLLLAVQVPVIGPFTFVPFAVVLPAMILAGVLILMLSMLCGLYPGWSATRIHPAEALHYE